jgi:hypothetical protein
MELFFVTSVPNELDRDSWTHYEFKPNLRVSLS